jgi:TolB-like protein/Tfp pilus assembly protein PilF
LLIVIAAVVVVISLIVWAESRFDAGRLWSSTSPRSAVENVVPRIDSVAVLPFVNASGDSQLEYVSESITEDIINSLSRLPNLRVMARSTVFAYKNKATDPRRIGRDLHVSAVLTGTFLVHGDDVTIQLDLVDVSDGSQLWGEQYRKRLADVASIPEDIAVQATQKMRLRLSGEQIKRLARRETQSQEAYRLFAQGQYFSNKATLTDFNKAVDYFQRAVEKDPDYASAYARLAESYAIMGTIFEDTAGVDKAKTAATMALALDEGASEAHTALALIRFLSDWDFRAADLEFKRALDGNSAAAHLWYSDYLSAMGRIDAAIGEARRAEDLDPLNPTAVWNVARTHYFARRYEEATKQCLKTLDMDVAFERGHYWLGLIHLMQGQYADALVDFRRAGDLAKTPAEESLSIALVYARWGKKDEAKTILRRYQERRTATTGSPWDLGLVYAALGDNNRAFELLDDAYRHRQWQLVRLNVEPQLDPLRSDPRLQDLARRIGVLPGP